MNTKIFCLLSIACIVDGKSSFTPLEIDNHPCKAENLKKSTRYICDNEGDIKCLHGWVKADHEDPLHPCSEPYCETCVNGVCRGPGVCACDVGWEGNDCDICVPLPGCQHGTCNNAALSCSCDEGYEGGLCDRPICNEGPAAACVHGSCMEPGKCSCYPGWQGRDCNTCIDLPGCVHGNCTDNNGTSVANACFCNEGWEGHLCDIPKCTPACHHGVCVNWKNVGPMCVCEFGWDGETCSNCRPYPGCFGGTCTVPGECVCEEVEEEGETDLLCGIHKVVPRHGDHPMVDPPALTITSEAPAV